ncbi:MAG: hypothetical protein JXM79_20565 [Sedimentisphaerales bacterium]|nr:hypothetical protein [Sedimentisphaerales bacterium]
MIHALFLEELSLWTWVWQSTLFVMIGLAGSFLLRHRPARACQGLFLAMVAAILVPVMSALVAHFGLGLFSSEPVTVQPEMTHQVVTIDYEIPEVVLSSNVQLDVEPTEVQADILPIQAPVEATHQGVVFLWRSVLLYGWVIAVVVLMGRLLVAFVGGICLLRRAKLPCSERIRRDANTARARIGITKDFRIRSGANVHSPMIWCWSRPPVLLVPADLDDRVDWVGVICHELAHWRRRDHLTGFMAELIVCILPWNPFLWWARKRVVRLSEQACDDWVLAGGRAGTDYAQSLLNLSPKVQMAFLPTMIGKEKPMKKRIYRIVREKCGNPRIGARWALAMTVITVTLTVGVALAQRRSERFEPRERDRGRVEEEREQRMLSEHREKLGDRARELEARMDKVKREVEKLEESGKGDSEEAHGLRADLREMRENMAEIEQELRECEFERQIRVTRRPWQSQEQGYEILRRLEELGNATEAELRRLEEQQPSRSEAAIDLYRRMWELNEHMREIRHEFRREFEETGRNRPESEDRERSEIDRRIQELERHLEELKINARDKERALHELEEQGKGETEDAHVVRRKLEDIHGRMQAVKKELEDVEREKVRNRESRTRYEHEQVPSPEAIMREREELEKQTQQIKRELYDLAGQNPERALMLDRQLKDIRKRIKEIEREPDRFERPQSHVEELHTRREHLRTRLSEIERVLAGLNEQEGKGEGKEQNLRLVMHEIREQLEATEREIQNVAREEPRRPERGDLEREVEELRIQVNNVNEQMGELRELLTRLLEERNPRER